VHPQENLDTICICARAFLNAPRLSSHDLTNEAVFRTPTAMRVFVRAFSDPCEALACICGPGQRPRRGAERHARRPGGGRAGRPDETIVTFREAVAK
jgi:hypothetical protein